MRNPNIQPGPMHTQLLQSPDNPAKKYLIRTQKHVDPDSYQNSSVVMEVYDWQKRRWNKVTLDPHAARHIMATLEAQDTRKQPPAQDHL